MTRWNLNKLKEYYYKRGLICFEEYKHNYIHEMKLRFKEKGLSSKERYYEMSKVLSRLFKEEIRNIKSTLDNKTMTIKDIQPVVAFRSKKDNNDFSMRLKKSKGVINRHCYQ